MIKSDSRRIKKGDIFVALPGIKSDGRDYIDDAIKNGAIKVIACSGNYGVDTVIVEDTRKYLNNYLKEHYEKYVSEMTIIGVTGTNGKTTTSYLLYQTLNKMSVNCSMIGTLGFYLDKKIYSLPNTCPDIALMYELLLDSYNNGYKYVVIEASSQGLDEERLFGIKFDYAVFTNLTHDHLDYHKTFENYALAKQKLFKQLKDDGKGIVNIDDEYSKYFISDSSITYGFSKCDYQLISYNDKFFSYKHSSNIFGVSFNLIGRHNAYNMMACIIVLLQMGFNVSEILSVIKDIDGPKGRMEIYNYLNNRIIIDYAHTPDAINNVLSSISDYNKLYVVFGCTGNRDKMKRSIMTKLVLDKCDMAIITCDDLYDEDFSDIVNDMINSTISDNYFVCFDRREAIKKGIDLLNDNDILLILGKGHEEVLKIGNKLIPFNDGKVVLEFINF